MARADWTCASLAATFCSAARASIRTSTWPAFDDVARLDVEGDDRAGHLRGDDRLPDGFHHAVEAGGVTGTRGLHYRSYQVAGYRADGRVDQTRDEGCA